ncbi:MAG TPA: hypothetical protein VI542_01890, partial [Candidatus Tectomicrobia bacterium]
MRRGLSRQQRQLLGIAVHAHRLTEAGRLAVKTGAVARLDGALEAMRDLYSHGRGHGPDRRWIMRCSPHVWLGVAFAATLLGCGAPAPVADPWRPCHTRAHEATTPGTTCRPACIRHAACSTGA